jgi:hypothetical protein
MFDKIKLEDISYHMESNNIIFSVALKDEKQILMASGRIHRHSTHGTGVWDITTGSVLTLTLPTNITDKPLKKIKQSFNEMVS